MNGNPRKKKKKKKKKKKVGANITCDFGDGDISRASRISIVARTGPTT